MGYMDYTSVQGASGCQPLFTPPGCTTFAPIPDSRLAPVESHCCVPAYPSSSRDSFIQVLNQHFHYYWVSISKITCLKPNTRFCPLKTLCFYISVNCLTILQKLEVIFDSFLLHTGCKYLKLYYLSPHLFISCFLLKFQLHESGKFIYYIPYSVFSTCKNLGLHFT